MSIENINKISITAISDLHGFFPELPGGDLLIVAGDLTARGTYKEYLEFFKWLQSQEYRKKVFIYGNHDNLAVSQFDWGDLETDYLCDSGTEFEWFETEDTKWGPKNLPGCRNIKLKIWGCPHSLTFPGLNPKCAAFTGTEDDLKKRYDLIPNDIDILISHTPFLHMLDQNKDGYHCGSMALREAVDRIKPRLFICGHIHEQGGNQLMYKHVGKNTWCVNASHVNERYQPINPVIRVQL